MKRCSYCNQVKQDSAFNKWSRSKDGLQPWCRLCYKAYCKKNRNKIIAVKRKYQESHREVGVLSSRKYYMANKKEVAERTKDYLRDHPEKYKARYALGNAVQQGRILRPDTCENCGKPKYVYGHHEDYSKPLEVLWVCSDCHGRVHQTSFELSKAK